MTYFLKQSKSSRWRLNKFDLNKCGFDQTNIFLIQRIVFKVHDLFEFTNNLSQEQAPKKVTSRNKRSIFSGKI